MNSEMSAQESFENWYKEWIQKPKGDTVQVRMVGTGNKFVCGIPPSYAVFRIDEQETDPTSKYWIGNGSIGPGEVVAPVMYFISQNHRLRHIGHVVLREHGYCLNDYYLHRSTEGFSFTEKGADKIAYRNAVEMAHRIAADAGAQVQDLTTQDLAEYVDVDDWLGLEGKIHNFHERFG